MSDDTKEPHEHETLEQWRERMDREAAERVRVARLSEALPLWAQLPEDWEP